MGKEDRVIKHTKRIVKPLLPPPSLSKLFLRAAWNVGVVVLILLGSLAIACVAVDQVDVGPDHPLYPFERLGERIRMASPQSLLQERWAEYALLLKEGKSAGYGYLLTEIQELVQKVQPGPEVVAQLQSIMPSIPDMGNLLYNQMLSSFAETRALDPQLRQLIEEMASENADFFGELQATLDELVAQWEARVGELRGRYEEELAMEEFLREAQENMEKIRLAAMMAGKEATYQQLLSRLRYVMWLKATIEKYRQQLEGLAAQIEAGLDREEARARLEAIRQSFRAEWEERLRSEPEAYYQEYLTGMQQFNALTQQITSMLNSLPPVVSTEVGKTVEVSTGGYETTIAEGKTVIEELTSEIRLKSVELTVEEEKLKAALDTEFRVRGRFNYSGSFSLDRLIASLQPSDVLQIAYSVPIIQQMLSSVPPSELERTLAEQMGRLQEAVREIMGGLPPFELQNVLQSGVLSRPIETTVSGVTISIYMEGGAVVLRVRYQGTLQSGSTTVWLKDIDAKLSLYGLSIHTEGATVVTNTSVGIDLSGGLAAITEVPVGDLLAVATAGASGESSSVTPSLSGANISLSKSPTGGILLLVSLGDVSTSLYGVNLKFGDLKAKLHLTQLVLDMKNGWVTFALGSETGVSGKVYADCEVAVLEMLRSLRLEDVILDAVNEVLETRMGTSLAEILNSPICQTIGFTDVGRLRNFIATVEGVVLSRIVPKMPWSVEWAGQRTPVVKVTSNDIRAKIYGADARVSNVEFDVRLIDEGLRLQFNGESLSMSLATEFGVWVDLSVGGSFDLVQVVESPLVKQLVSGLEVRDGALVWEGKIWQDLLSGSEVGAEFTLSE
ncbi:MAG: hypothetical protein QXQ45_03745, partial [Candidatus Hadarchaeales archaeon]